jgi:protein SCO1/2
MKGGKARWSGEGRYWRVVCVLLLSICLGVGAASWPAIAHEKQRASGGPEEPFLSVTPSLSVIKPAPNFALRDTAARMVRLSALRGRVVLLSFIYTHCSAACPLLTQQMALLQTRLKHAGVRAHGVHFLSVTVDPVRDSADTLGRYAKRFAIDPDQWQFLREEPERLAPVLSAYDEWRRPLANGDIDHPARLYLIDQRGRIREIYSLGFFDERQAFLDVRVLLQEPQ